MLFLTLCSFETLSTHCIKTVSVTDSGLTALLGPCATRGMAFTGRTPGEKRFPVFKLYCLGKERQEWADKLGDANGHKQQVSVEHLQDRIISRQPCLELIVIMYK